MGGIVRIGKIRAERREPLARSASGPRPVDPAGHICQRLGIGGNETSDLLELIQPNGIEVLSDQAEKLFGFMRGDFSGFISAVVHRERKDRIGKKLFESFIGIEEQIDIRRPGDEGCGGVFVCDRRQPVDPASHSLRHGQGTDVFEVVVHGANALVGVKLFVRERAVELEALVLPLFEWSIQFLVVPPGACRECADQRGHARVFVREGTEPACDVPAVGRVVVRWFFADAWPHWGLLAL